jgi:signal transduction histidine kinase
LTLLSWLRAVPIDDPVERRHAPALQFLMLFMAFTLPANWAYHLLVVRTPIRPDMKIDLAVDVLVWVAAWVSFAMIRRGLLRRAVGLFVLAMLAALALMYLSIGLTRQMLDQTYPVLTIVLGGLVLGRRWLWWIYASIVLMMWGGGIVDVFTLQARAYPRPWLGAANAPSMSMSYFVITLVLDRCVAAMRNGLDEARRLSVALAALNATLRDEMAGRERAQESLVHAQKMEAIGRLSSGVAHDVSQVLAVITGYVERSRTDNDTRGALAGIAAAADRGASITRKLLSFGRSEKLRPEVFDIVAGVHDVRPMLRQLLPAGVTLDVQPDIAAFPIRMDRAQFELMFLNIAANARDALGGRGRFAVRVAAHDGGVRVSLADDGPGMTEAARQKVFEPFFTTKGPGQGTGLGLAIVRESTEAAGGRVGIATTVGGGCTIELWFPRGDAIDEGPAAATLRVLLVEHDDTRRDLLLEDLDAAGCIALGARDEWQARQLLEDAGDAIEVVVVPRRLETATWLAETPWPIAAVVIGGDVSAGPALPGGIPVVRLPGACGGDALLAAIADAGRLAGWRRRSRVRAA